MHHTYFYNNILLRLQVTDQNKSHLFVEKTKFIKLYHWCYHLLTGDAILAHVGA